MASGKMAEAEFTNCLAAGAANLAAEVIDGAAHDVCMYWRKMAEV